MQFFDDLRMFLCDLQRTAELRRIVQLVRNVVEHLRDRVAEVSRLHNLSRWRSDLPWMVLLPGDSPAGTFDLQLRVEDFRAGVRKVNILGVVLIVRKCPASPIWI